MTLQDLINSYDYSYSDGTLNATSQNDYMIDTNNNGINDTLIINLTVNSTYTSFFEVYFDLAEESGTLSDSRNLTVIIT